MSWPILSLHHATDTPPPVSARSLARSPLLSFSLFQFTSFPSILFYSLCRSFFIFLFPPNYSVPFIFLRFSHSFLFLFFSLLFVPSLIFVSFPFSSTPFLHLPFYKSFTSLHLPFLLSFPLLTSSSLLSFPYLHFSFILFIALSFIFLSPPYSSLPFIFFSFPHSFSSILLLFFFFFLPLSSLLFHSLYCPFYILLPSPLSDVPFFLVISSSLLLSSICFPPLHLPFNFHQLSFLLSSSFLLYVRIPFLPLTLHFSSFLTRTFSWLPFFRLSISHMHSLRSFIYFPICSFMLFFFLFFSLVLKPVSVSVARLSYLEHCLYRFQSPKNCLSHTNNDSQLKFTFKLQGRGLFIYLFLHNSG